MDLSHYLSLMLFLSLFINYTHAATFEIRNQCPHTVWAAAHCGCRLDRGQTWTINVASGTKQASVWAQTKCNFDAAGRGRCETSGFGGLLYGTPPNTSTEYALNQFNNLDFFDVSHVDGFNVLMAFNPVSNKCRGIRCTADINGQCPRDLKAPGGYNNSCTVFNTDQYCCNFSRFFKQRHLPNAYSYPKDDQTSTFTCPGGTNYRIVFYP